VGLGASDDRIIWAYARQTGSVIVTKDADFASMRRRSDDPQVVWLRIGNASAEEIISRFETGWEGTIDFLRAGEPVVQV
jgi:predicted nuclease of predicted toxin-antitoxin system